MSDVAASVEAAQAVGERIRLGRLLSRALIVAISIFVLLWVLVFAKNAAIHNPNQFIHVFVDGLTLAGLYFVVASGFTLIFGLMRVVNMAHGSFYLLGGYIAFEVQKHWGNWGLGFLIAALGVGASGVLMQQLFLRWNQGQDLRQALITIAISIVMADQFLANFGGITKNLEWPPQIDFVTNWSIFGITYPFGRIFILLTAAAVGIGLWLWLKRTRTGMIVLAGVDDRHMVAALGINIQRVFLIAFGVGSALAGLGGVLGGSQLGLAPGVDASFLLNSLIVVIIGGMGSLGGAAIGALLFGLVDVLSDIYLPQQYSNYSVLVTFGLLVAVLAVKPLGLYGRPA
jgi:branched-chain amino acid transport system permease protein